MSETTTPQTTWEERNREQFAQIAAMPRKPGQEKLWTKLDALKTRLKQE